MFMEPSITFEAMIPSEESAGRMERCFPQRNLQRETELPPMANHP